MSGIDASVAFGTIRNQPKIENSWVLYYSPEGYPYYYNHITGESQWAESSHHDQFDASLIQYETKGTEQDDVIENDESENDSEEDSEESSDDSESESSDDTDIENLKKRVVEPVDPQLEERFKAYLRTPEGMAAMETEQARVAKKLGVKINQKVLHSRRKELEKLRNKAFKSRNVGNGIGDVAKTIDFAIDSFFRTWVDPYRVNAIEKAAKDSKGSQKTKPAKTTAATYSDVDTDDDQKKLRARKVKRVPESDDDLILAKGGGRRMHGWEKSPLDESTTSTSSSENDSVSSDDSDVAEIMSPVLPSWLSLSGILNLYSRGVATILRKDTTGYVDGERSRKDGGGRDAETAAKDSESETEGSDIEKSSDMSSARRKSQRETPGVLSRGFLETVSIGATQVTTTVVGGAVSLLFWFLSSTGDNVLQYGGALLHRLNQAVVDAVEMDLQARGAVETPAIKPLQPTPPPGPPGPPTGNKLTSQTGPTSTTIKTIPIFDEPSAPEIMTYNSVSIHANTEALLLEVPSGISSEEHGQRTVQKYRMENQSDANTHVEGGRIEMVEE